MKSSLAILLIAAMLLLAGCSNEDEASLLTGKVIAQQGSEELKTVKISCDNKEDLVAKIREKQELLKGYDQEMDKLSKELEQYYQEGNFQGIKNIQFDAEKALKLRSNEQKNLEALQNLLKKCK